MATILLVDDESAIRDGLSKWLRMDGHSVECARDGHEALMCLGRGAIDIALIDLRLPGIDGLEVVRRLKREVNVGRRPAVVMITAYGSIESAVTALKDGADEYLCKPVDPAELSAVINRLLAARAALAHAEPKVADLAQSWVGVSPAAAAARAFAAVAAQSDTPFLVSGPPGVGKRLLCALIHARSARQLLPFVVQLCDPSTRLANWPLGPTHKLPLLLAHAGTVVLDGAEQLSTAQLAQLDGCYRELCADPQAGPRLVATASSPRALEPQRRLELVERWQALSCVVPPLDERRQDIAILVLHLLGRLATPAPQVEPAALTALCARAYPGNVAELEALLLRAALRARDNVITVTDLG